MNALLIILLVILGTLMLMVMAAVAATIVGAKKVKKSVQGKQELVPGHKSAAPLNWNGSPKREAVQHRRLVKAMQLARSVHSEQEAEVLGKQAIMIERELVHTSLLPKEPRKQALETTESLVASVEELATGVYERNSSLPTIQTDLSELRERLQLLAEAHRELG